MENETIDVKMKKWKHRVFATTLSLALVSSSLLYGSLKVLQQQYERRAQYFQDNPKAQLVENFISEAPLHPMYKDGKPLSRVISNYEEAYKGLKEELEEYEVFRSKYEDFMNLDDNILQEYIDEHRNSNFIFNDYPLGKFLPFTLYGIGSVGLGCSFIPLLLYGVFKREKLNELKK